VVKLSKMTYKKAGVSIDHQNQVNEEIMKRLQNKGIDMKGLFGGTIDISRFKGKKHLYLNIFCHPVSGKIENMKALGSKAAEEAFSCIGKETPMGVLDYIASSKMESFIADFVEGIAEESLRNKCSVVGGESAQMRDTYNKDMFDAFVHVLTLNDKSGVCDISNIVNSMERPILVASTDGTGTKTKIIRNPEDVIYHGFNDTATLGARPVCFSLYIAGNENLEDIIKIGLKAQKKFKKSDFKILQPKYVRNGEVYLEGELDIAGTAVGIVDKKDIIDGSNVKKGDVIVGIATDGLMTNGYTLARRLCNEITELNKESLKEELSRPHRYFTDVLFGYENIEGVLTKFRGKVKGMAHITGGGQDGNIIRMIPSGLIACLSKDVLPVPRIMNLFGNHGVSQDELYRTFNMGIGFTLTVSNNCSKEITNYINKNFRYSIKGVDRKAAQIGEII